MNAPPILVVDDDADLRRLVRTLLERSGHRVVEAADGTSALREFRDSRPALVVLDVGLPGLDGWATLERLRDVSDAPVLMLTAQDGELERVRGLRTGADDYVSKPFGRLELLARVEALLRRSTTRAGEERGLIGDDLIQLDLSGQRATIDGRDLRLTGRELRLMSAFCRHPGRALTPSELLDLAWGGRSGNSVEQVKLYVSYLRRKLDAAAPGSSSAIETLRGTGYRYRPVRSALP